MNRRNLLHGAAAALSGLTLSASTKLWATSGASARLIVIFLRGGYDALTLLVPRVPFYNEVRPNIAVPVAQDNTPGATPLDTDWALHPAVEDSVLPLVRAGQLRFLPFAGCEDMSRSHFETQDTIELGQPIGSRRDYQSGFMNRLAQALGGNGAGPIAFTEQLPLTMRGQRGGSVCSIRIWTFLVACSAETFPAVAARPRTSRSGSCKAKAMAKAPSIPGSATRTILRTMAGDSSAHLHLRRAKCGNGSSC